MRKRPKSIFEDESGCIQWWRVGEEPEFTEVVAWDKEYANECDRLAEIEAVNTGKRHWGRWYLTKTNLMTRAAKPNVDRSGFSQGGWYDIALDRLGESWEEHMKEKNWIGEKGHCDLGVALQALRSQ